jgi:hypothetical protein
MTQTSDPSAVIAAARKLIAEWRDGRFRPHALADALAAYDREAAALRVLDQPRELTPEKTETFRALARTSA